MKIKKEDFYKLKQLDRIEYRQRERKIDEIYSCGFTYPVIIIMFLVLSFVLLVGFAASALTADAEILRSTFSDISSIIGIFTVLVVVSFTADVLSFLSKQSKKSQLEEEYFGVSIKKNDKAKVR